MPQPHGNKEVTIWHERCTSSDIIVAKALTTESAGSRSAEVSEKLSCSYCLGISNSDYTIQSASMPSGRFGADIVSSLTEAGDILTWLWACVYQKVGFPWVYQDQGYILPLCCRRDVHRPNFDYQQLCTCGMLMLINSNLEYRRSQRHCVRLSG